ncbi:MAG TPA: NAD(P)/FAD-dependent oxidoreductase [Edaphocola sp.]|nr:NAD(P)/FAD-dependent oxidoreductase [Edaphocola sp.]
MKIVIVGGGFAGINLAKSLSKNKNFQIILVDENNYHFFPPLIYQVASAFIEPSNISLPFRRMFQNKENIRFFNAQFLSLNKDEQFIITDKGNLKFDKLVLAMGAETNYFGLKNVQKNALSLKNINDALNIRNSILLTLEKACELTDVKEQEKLLTFVVSGGGPTGVEISGMIAEMGNYIMNKDYPELINVKRRIILVDAGSSLLGPMSEKSQHAALSQMKKLGVKVKLNVAVKDFIDDKVYLADGSIIETPTLIWVSGIIAKQAEGLPEESIGKGRRILVNEYNQVLNTNDIYAIGDICMMHTDKNFPNGHPQVAQPAIQQGKLLAKNLNRQTENIAMKAFEYNDKGSMAIISKFKAVVDLPKGFMKGFLAWLIWLFIHILPIAGFRNRVKLFFNWMWTFITNDPTIRLIIKSKPEKEEILN